MIYYEKPTTGYKDLSEQQVEELQEVFSCGRCWVLAVTLHRMFGYPISAVIDTDDYLEHAWVVRPDGMEIDIMGVNDVCWGKPTHIGMVEEAFLSSFKGAGRADSPRAHASLSDAEFDHCKQMVEDYLSPTFQLNSPLVLNPVFSLTVSH
jgi:hypothetical protein